MGVCMPGGSGRPVTDQPDGGREQEQRQHKQPAALDGLEVAVRVAVASDESPPLLVEAADIVVGSTDEFLGVLRKL